MGGGGVAAAAVATFLHVIDILEHLIYFPRDSNVHHNPGVVPACILQILGLDGKRPPPPATAAADGSTTKKLALGGARTLDFLLKNTLMSCMRQTQLPTVLPRQLIWRDESVNINNK